MSAVVTFCATCDGPISRRWSLSNPDEQPWLHMHREDWIDDPHDATPGRTVLVSAEEP